MISIFEVLQPKFCMYFLYPKPYVPHDVITTVLFNENTHYGGPCYVIVMACKGLYCIEICVLPFTPGKHPVPIVQEAGWASGPVWMVADNLAPHRDSIPGPSSP
jgi:hypothetical protein